MDAQNATLYTTIVIGCVIIGCILIYFFISVIRQQRKNMELQRNFNLAEITALEKDRARIAKDLHDEFAPILSGIKMKINAFELRGGEDKDHLKSTNDHIDFLMSRLLEISFDLIPMIIQHNNLKKALTEFVEFINNKNSLDVRFFSNAELEFNEQKGLNLYRIVQEIIHNTIKHAKAETLVISIIKEKNRIILTSHDDGIGFDEKSIPQGKSLGLRSLYNRAQLLGGEMFLETKAGAGTAYTFTIPH